MRYTNPLKPKKSDLLIAHGKGEVIEFIKVRKDIIETNPILKQDIGLEFRYPWPRRIWYAVKRVLSK